MDRGNVRGWAGWGFALGLAVLVAGGCAKKAGQTGPGPATPSPAKAKIRIGLVTNGRSEFWHAMEVGMKDAADKLGVDASWQGPDPATIENQREMIENYKNQGVKLIGISPIDPNSMGPEIDSLIDEGMSVITFDSDAANSKRLVYIGTNNYKAGRVAGEEAKKIFSKGSILVAFVGNIDAQNAKDRLQGFRDATSGFITVRRVYEDNKDQTKAKQNAEDALRSEKGLAGFLGLYSYNGHAIAAAVEEAGAKDKYKIVCFDAELKTQEAIEKGLISATVVQKPYMFGYLSVAVLHDMAAIGVDNTLMMLPPDRIIDTGVEVVNQENIKEFRQRLKRWGVTSS